jgi:hypothetical protein
MRPLLPLLPLFVLAACTEAPEVGAISGDASLEYGDLDLLPAEAQLPPPNGGILTNSAAIAGHPLRMRSVGHPATSSVRFFRGQSGSTCSPLLNGGCLDLNNPTQLASDPSDMTRTAEATINVPGGLAAGLSTLIQAANTNAGGFPSVISNTRQLTIETVTECPAGSVSVVRNGDAELNTGDWVGSFTPTNQSNTGVRAMETNGNLSISQDIIATPVSSLMSARFWTWHDPAEGAIQSIEFRYSDGTAGSTLVFNTTVGNGWEQIDLLPLLDPAKQLSGIVVWGYSGGGPGADLMRADSFKFCTM